MGLYSAEEIFSFADDEDPVFWSESYTRKVLEAHGTTLDAFVRAEPCGVGGKIDAARVLAWLGY